MKQIKPLSPFSPGLHIRPEESVHIQSVKAEKPTMTSQPEPTGIDLEGAFALFAFSLAIVKRIRR